ncbi:MAG: hypothetical protein PWP28_2745, partial [Oceanotoga sp.]|uniref:glycosyltransferase n=1 Tax=Oceanotoga sp. TaxID=2108366 RepID=UPI00264DE444
LKEDEYNSEYYREWIENNYCFEEKIYQINHLFENVINFDIKNKNITIDYLKFNLKNNFEIIMQENFSNIFFEDLTIIIPTYNRSEILNYDLINGLKFKKQNKIIIDDNSKIEDKNILYDIQNKKNFYGIQEVIFNDKNLGVSSALKNAIKKVNTDKISFLGDDDLLIVLNENLLMKEYEQMNENILIPRYMFNLDNKNNISLGYDRKDFNNFSFDKLLKKITISGEISGFNSGAFFSTYEIKNNLAEDFFKVGEDYVILSRILGNNLKKDRRIKVTENYIYFRRLSNKSLSRIMDKEKIIIHFISLIISSYYCLKKNLLKKEEIKSSISYRGNVLEKFYGYGNQVSKLIIKFLNKEFNFEDFIIYLDEIGFKKLNLNNIPFELRTIQKYL